MSTSIGTAPQGNAPVLGIPTSQDIPRLVITGPYFESVALAEIIAPTVTEAVEAQLPSLVPPYVQAAADAAVQQLAVLKTGSTMSGPLMLAPLMPTADSMAATKAYVDTLVATAGVPEVPAVPIGQVWARTTGQWVPLDPSGGNFLPIAGGTMQGMINMSGYAINNLAALPNMPNGAAPANWVLQQIASVSLYQGTWNLDTYTPDLTNPATHVNGYTWIAITASTSGVVIGPAIPGLQGQTVFNGDTIIWSNIQGMFNRIHSGGLSLAEAEALFLPYTGGTMTGPLLAFENPTATMEVATMGWVESLLPPGGVIPEAPTDGQLYGRNGLTKVWLPVLPLAGGVMTGPIMLSGNATNALSPVPLQQMTSTLAATYLALSGGTMTGPMVLSGNASANLNPVPLQQVNSMLSGFLPISGGTLTGPLMLSGNAAANLNAVPLQQLNSTITSTLAGYLQLAGGTLTGPLTLSGNAGTALQAVPLQQLNSVVAGYLPLGGGTLTGDLNIAVGAGSNATVLTQVAGARAWWTGTASNGAFAITDSTAGATRLTIDATGNVGVAGSLTAGALASSAGISAAGNLIVSGAATLSNGLDVHGSGIAYTSYANNAIALFWNTASQLWLYVDNTVVGMFNITPSDERLKENLAAVSVDCLSVLDQVQLQQFDWIPTQFSPSRPHVSCGFTAQDLQNLIPEAVASPGGASELLSVDLMSLVSYCVGAIQQLSARMQAIDGKAA